MSRLNRPSSLWGKLAMAGLLTAALVGCGGGSDGTNGTNGANGAPGAQGPAGVNANDVTLVADLTPDQWKAMKWSAKITSASVPADGKPVVTFKVTDEKGKPIVGLGYPSFNTTTSGTAIAPAYAHFGFTFAKLVPATVDGPSKWVTYIVTSTPTYKSLTDRTVVPAAQRLPTTDNQGKMVDNGDGSYTYTFYRNIKEAQALVDAPTNVYSSVKLKADLGDLSYNPALTHRVAMQLQGTMPGTGTNTPDGITVRATVASTNPVAAFLDFRPDGAAMTEGRTITKVDACQSCHAGVVLHARKDPNLCVTCHTDQIKYGYALPTLDASGNYPLVAGATVRDSAAVTVDGATKFSNFNFPRWVHKLHMGEELVKQNYNMGGVTPNDIAYPQDVRNCTKCHTASAATPQGNNWKTKPTRLACGSCHDGIDFTTGTGTALKVGATGHMAGKGYTNDEKCSSCHEAADIAAYHIPVTPIDPNNIRSTPVGGNQRTNAASIAAYTNNLPVGAIPISYDVTSVTVDASKHAVVKFKLLMNGVSVAPNTYSAAGKTEIWDNFVGSPSVYVRFNAEQDGIAAPSDFNANVSGYMKNLWNGTATGTGAGTLAYDTATGIFTATLTGVAIPTTAKMVVGGIGYTYDLVSTPPLVQTNLVKYPYDATTKVGGLLVAAPNAWRAQASSRRILVENSRCNTCHEKIGVFGKSSFHGAQRNDAPTCNFCHNPVTASSGWSANASTFIHGIHAGAGGSAGPGLSKKRTEKFTWENNAFVEVGYPGGISKCEACHLPDVVNYGAIYTRASSSDLTPISSSTSVAAFQDSMLYSTTAAGTLTNNATTVLSPYVVSGTAYDTGAPAFDAVTGKMTSKPANLVSSPIAAACFSCHDTVKAQTHIVDIGNGSLYQPRATAILRKETCLSCHGAGKVADAQVVHQ